MTVSELIDKLKDCAPGADVTYWTDNDGDGDWTQLRRIAADGETVKFS
jgi:hypothetical protein